MDQLRKPAWACSFHSQESTKASSLTTGLSITHVPSLALLWGDGCPKETPRQFSALVQSRALVRQRRRDAHPPDTQCDLRGSWLLLQKISRFQTPSPLPNIIAQQDQCINLQKSLLLCLFFQKSVLNLRNDGVSVKRKSEGAVFFVIGCCDSCFTLATRLASWDGRTTLHSWLSMASLFPSLLTLVWYTERLAIPQTYQ